MKNLHHNKLKTQNYYNHLFTFFTFISLLLALTLVKFEIVDFALFLLKFIILFFLLMLISVMVEYMKRGEYISPITFYNLEHFFNEFLLEVGTDGHFEKFFNKYDSKSKKAFRSIFEKHALTQKSIFKKNTFNDFQHNFTKNFSSKTFGEHYKKNFFLSSIRKNKNVYELTIIDEIKVLQFFIIKFFVKKGVHKLYVKQIDHEFKIIRLV